MLAVARSDAEALPAVGLVADVVAERAEEKDVVPVAHGDHWFGIGALLERFPGARAVASPAVVRMMKERPPEALKAWWEKLLPGQLPERVVIAEELAGGVIKLEGQDLVIVEVGHTDTHDTTVLHVPSIGLVVAGDAAYNGVHQLLSETDPPKRREWIAALDKIESLKPRTVIAGHKRPGSEDSPRIIEETRQYARDFDRLAETTKTGRELYDEMLKLHPLRMNVNARWTSALAAKR